MEKKEYQKIVDKHTPKGNKLNNAIIAFVIGGFMGVLGNFLIEIYSYYFNLSSKDASVFMIITLIFGAINTYINIKPLRLVNNCI